MFRRKYRKRSTFLPFIIFRLLLSLVIFVALLGGIYYAYKEFSGFDPVKLNPKAAVLTILSFAPKNDITDQVRSVLNSPQQLDNQSKQSGQKVGMQGADRPNPQRKLLFKFAILADSHSDNNTLEKALRGAQGESSDKNNLAFIIGLGDYTEVGTLQELEAVKGKLTQSGIRFFVTSGDHDLWDSRNKGINPRSNFNKVFGPSFQAFEHQNAKFIILDNSDNYLGIDENQMKWLEVELSKLRQEPYLNVRFVMLHEPLYHPSSERVMGKVEPKLKDQAKDLIRKFKNAGISEVFAGDIHFFTRYSDPGSMLPMATIGSLASQRNTQNPRYALVSVFDDGSFEVEDVEIK